MIEMKIDSIRMSMMNYHHVVILKEKGTDRYLPIWIGPAESEAIRVRLENIDAEISRPLTHDLLKNTIFAFESLSGASVSRVLVNDLRSDTFYAQIIFEFNDGPIPTKISNSSDKEQEDDPKKNSPLTILWQQREYNAKVISKWQDGNLNFIEAENTDGLLFELCYDPEKGNWLITKIKLDSRPSDAIALAVRVTTPIYVEDSVLDKAGIILDKETGKPILQAKQGEQGGSKDKLDEQELEKLSAFYDFINTLDLDDLGKRKS